MPSAPLASLVDPFTSAAIGPWWTSVSAGVTQDATHGWIAVPLATTASTFRSVGTGFTYDVRGSAVYGKVTPAPIGTGVLTIFKLDCGSGNFADAFLSGTTFTFQAGNSSTGVTSMTLPTYDPTAHAWWRIAESAGQFTFSVSADGFAWTALATISYSFSAAAAAFFFQTGTGSGITPAAGQYAYLSNLNTPDGPSTLMPSWPQIRFQVAFNQGANTSGQPAFVDLSSRLRGSWSAELSGRQYELDQVQSGQMSLTLWNLDGALDPLNTSSPYAPNVLPLRPARMQAVWPPARNLFPQDISNGTSTTAEWYAYRGSPAPVTGLTQAPTGHTTATAWTFPIIASGASGYPLLTGTTAGSADASAMPVTGGRSYTLSLYLSRSSGGDTTLQLNPKILFYDATGAQVGTSASGSVTVPVAPSWTPYTVTATAPATAVSARFACWLVNSATTAVNTIYLTAMQLEQATAATPWTAGGALYPLWQGFVERWPQQWDYQGTYGTVAITCVDALASLAQFTLQANFQASLQALGPNFSYAFNEPTGSTSFADFTGRKPPRIVGTSVAGAGSGAVTAGSSIQGSGAVGVAGPVVTVTNSPTGSNTSPSPGRFIATSASNTFPPATGGWTRLICFRTTASSPSGGYQTLWNSVGPAFWSGQPGSQAVFQLAIDSNNHGYGWISNANASATTAITVPDVVCNDGNWHIIIAQLSADGKTFTVAVDNHGYQSTTTGDYHPTGCVTDGIGAVEYHSIGWFSNAFAGDIAFATEFGYAIGNSAAFDLGNGFALGWSGETSAARAQRILNMANYQGKLSTLDASIAMGAANLAGVDAMSALQLVGDTEAGQVYVDGAGVLWLASRQWRYLQSAASVTFGENSGEVPYLGDVEVELDDTHIYNDVTVQNQAVPGQTEQPSTHITDATSQAAYLPRSVQRTINTQDQTIQQSAAQYLLTQYAQPLARVGQLTVDGAANPALWSTILGLGFGTRADVKRRPPSALGATAITVQAFIEHVTWNGDDQGNLKLGLQLSPAQPYLGWGVVSSLHTTVASASTAGTATVTLAALTGSSLNPAAAVLVPGTQLTLGYGTANAETLTVKSVPATSPGYTSVAVTFTTNTAHNHAVNEVVCQPQPSGLTLPPAVQAAYPASLDAAATLSATTPRVAY